MLDRIYIASICIVSHRGCDGLIAVIARAGRGTPKTKDLGRHTRGEIKPGRCRAKLERRPEQRVPLVPLEPDFAR